MYSALLAAFVYTGGLSVTVTNKIIQSVDWLHHFFISSTFIELGKRK